MKTIKSIKLVMLIVLSISIFATSCDDEPTEVFIEEICGCMDATAINYNAEANCDDQSCILPSQLDDTTRTFYSTADHSADGNNSPWLDKAHSSVRWDTDYSDLGFSNLTGRFGSFDGDITFNEKDPSLTVMQGWVRLSTQNTTEPGRDDPGNCGPGYHEVVWITHDIIIGNDTFTIYDSTDASTDFAYLDVTGGEYYYNSNKRGFTTSLKSTGTLTYLGVTGDVDVFFNYHGIDYDAGRSGFKGFFEFNSISDYGQTSTSIGDPAIVNFNMQMRGL